MVTASPSRAPRFLLLATTAVIVSCAASDAEAPDAVLPQWSLEEDLRMGAVDDPDYAYTSIRGLAIAPDGSHFYTMHPQDAQIRRWTADGRPAGSVGRRGEGPGEFEGPSDMGWTGDTLWVMDGRNYRLTWFLPDGTYVRDVPVEIDIGSREQAAEGIYPPRQRTLMGDGSMYGMTPGWSQEIAEGTLTEITHVRMGTDGSLLDTLAVLPTSRADVLGILRDGGGTFTSQPFGDGVVHRLSADRESLLVLERSAVAVAEGTPEYHLTRIGLDGDTIFRRSYPYTPIPIPAERVDSAVDAQAGSLHEWLGERTGTPLAQWQTSVREGLWIPDHHPAVTSMHAGRDGTIWLQTTDPAAAGGAWLVLDEAGEPMARVETPAGFRPLVLGMDAIWGVERDELDVEYLVRYRLAMP